MGQERERVRRVREANELIEALFFNCKCQAVLDAYALALSTARKREGGAWVSLIDEEGFKNLFRELPLGDRAKRKRIEKVRKSFEALNKAISIDLQTAYEYCKEAGYEEIAEFFLEKMREGYELFATPLFESVFVNPQKKVAELNWSRYIAPFLEALRGFTLYDLKVFLSLRSGYSKKLYRLVKKWQKVGRKVYSVEELKLKLGVTGYRNFKDFRRRVLAPSVGEINAKTDLNIEYFLHKDGVGGKVHKVEFVISPKTKNESGKNDENENGKESTADFILSIVENEKKKYRPKLLALLEELNSQLRREGITLHQLLAQTPADTLVVFKFLAANIHRLGWAISKLAKLKNSSVINPEAFLISFIPEELRKKLSWIDYFAPEDILPREQEEKNEENIINVWENL
jgi:plasmid replication initiation protein